MVKTHHIIQLHFSIINLSTLTQGLPKIAIANRDLCPLISSDDFWSVVVSLFYVDLIFNEILLTNI